MIKREGKERKEKKEKFCRFSLDGSRLWYSLHHDRGILGLRLTSLQPSSTPSFERKYLSTWNAKGFHRNLQREEFTENNVQIHFDSQP